MSIPRVYQADLLSNTEIFQLGVDASKHLAKVLRLAVNDKVILFNGDGQDYLASIIAIQAKQIQVKIESQRTVANESPLTVTLFQGVSRGDRMDFAIRKAVECGVTHLIPIITDHCSVSLKRDWQKRHQHWKNIIISACEQSGRAVLPTISLPIDFNQALLERKDTFSIIADPTSNQTLSQLPEKDLKKIAIFIGPEGGFNEKEVRQAALAGVKPVGLGPRILRTETAPIVVISVLQSRYGDF